MQNPAAGRTAAGYVVTPEQQRLFLEQGCAPHLYLLGLSFPVSLAVKQQPSSSYRKMFSCALLPAGHLKLCLKASLRMSQVCTPARHPDRAGAAADN